MNLDPTREAASIDLTAEAASLAPALPVLPALRASALSTWRGRMKNEYSSSRVFEGLASQMERAGMAPELVAEVRGFAEEERRHGVMCGAVVEALGGCARTSWRDEGAFPEHLDARSPLEAVLRNLISVCCLSETVAVALIGAERMEMPEGELRELLTRIYADEVGHARFGWRVLEGLSADLDDEIRGRLGLYLRVAFAHLEEHELAHLPASVVAPEGGEALGLCSGADARALFFDTVTEVIVPGLARHGLPARRAWEERTRV